MIAGSQQAQACVVLITKLKSLLGSVASEDEKAGDRPLELACAALMFEVARADFAVDEAEQRAVFDLLTVEFNLSPVEIDSVTEAAADKADAATCLFEFTRAINNLASVDQKRGDRHDVAVAGGQCAQPLEEHLIRKVAIYFTYRTLTSFKPSKPPVMEHRAPSTRSASARRLER